MESCLLPPKYISIRLPLHPFLNRGCTLFARPSAHKGHSNHSANGSSLSPNLLFLKCGLAPPTLGFHLQPFSPLDFPALGSCGFVLLPGELGGFVFCSTIQAQTLSPGQVC